MQCLVRFQGLKRNEHEMSVRSERQHREIKESFKDLKACAKFETDILWRENSQKR
jgi:hypothetical protein